MRVFYAVTFSKSTKEAIVAYRDMIANSSVKGRFTDKNNFHLTLVYIGEVSQVELEGYLVILENLDIGRLNLTASYIGSFKRRDREMLWMGLEKNQALLTLHKQLTAALKAHGFEGEDRKYAPHITLGRQVLMIGGLEDLVIDPLHITPYSIALMESKRVGERLIYEPVAEVQI